MFEKLLKTGACLTTAAFLAASAAAADAEWPGFRGPARTGSVTGRLVDGDTAGLEVGWKRALGAGYSAVAVSGGRVVTMFADGDADYLGAYDAESGDELWRYRVGETYAGHSGSHDGPISTPLIAGGRVFGLGPHGHLFAVDASSGEAAWAKHVVDDLGGKAPFYGFTSSPVMVDGVLVVAIGGGDGKAVAGLDPGSGEVLWTVGDDGVEYQSPITAVIGDKELVLVPANEKLFGIEAASGKMLFAYEHGGDERAMGGRTIVPVPAGKNRFFLMNKFDSSSMIEIEPTKELEYDVEVLWSDKSISKSYVVPVYHDGHLYGISGRILTCVDAGTGEIKWRSRQPGDGFLTMVGNKLVVMTKPGGLHLASVSPEGYYEMARLDLFDEHSWSEVAIAGDRLFARSMGHLARVDVSSSGSAMERADAWLAGTAFGKFLAEVAEAEDKKAVVDAFMAGQEFFPVIEGPNVVHFIYRGEAEDVGIVGDMIGFRREDPMRRVPGTDLFYYSMHLEPDAAVSYGFIKNYGEEAEPDPLNPHTTDGLFGEVSWLAMPAWTEPAFVAEAAADLQGTFETVEWEREVTVQEDGEETTKTEKRTARVYLPAGFDPEADRRYPTVYVHNGKSALEEGAMKHTLDNLIGSRIEPVIAVFPMPREGQEGDDIGRAETHLEMIAGELVPLIDDKYPTIPEASARASVGAGSGGTVALLSGFQQSDVFGRIGSQSAVLFGVSMASVLEQIDSKPPLVIYMDWGTYGLRSPHEAWDMVEENRKGWSVLREAGYRPAGGEVPEGVSWNCWRGHSDELLTALFPLQDRTRVASR